MIDSSAPDHVELCLERIDPNLNCVESEVRLRISSLEVLAELLSTPSDVLHEGFSIELEPPEAVALLAVATCDGELKPGRLRLRSLCSLDCLPYRLHTNRELGLMLDGRKPLAVFRRASTQSFEDVCDQPFGCYVETGVIYRHAFSLEIDAAPGADSESISITYDMFTLPGEAWRAEAMRLLMLELISRPWTLEQELLEGALLGYTGGENDTYRQYLLDPNSPLYRPKLAERYGACR